ncbi:MAG: hypothetical protein H7Y18_18155 [Clostridiaceae bacterium]|nr:hypothetical protein [Clostridiaceae bacterium]
MKKDENYLTIPEAADLLRGKLKCKCINRYDKLYRNILFQAKSGMFNPIKINTRDLAISKQEFMSYVEKQTNEKYEQLKFDLNSFYNDIPSANNIRNELGADELLTLIKLNKKLEIPADETLKQIERLLIIYNQRGV